MIPQANNDKFAPKSVEWVDKGEYKNPLECIGTERIEGEALCYIATYENLLERISWSLSESEWTCYPVPPTGHLLHPVCDLMRVALYSVEY